jgi:hypothetical protein
MVDWKLYGLMANIVNSSLVDNLRAWKTKMPKLQLQKMLASPLSGLSKVWPQN